MTLKNRCKTFNVYVENIWIWGDFPVRIQSMTNTPTRDIQATVEQIIELVDAGSELVRITVNDDEASQAVPEIIRQLKEKGKYVPIIGDFHYNGHTLLRKYPEMAKALAKYRINPGNVWKWEKKDDQFRQIIDCAIQYDKPVRIGVNGGSLDEDLLNANMEANAKLENPLTASEVYIDTMVESWVLSANKAVEWGLPQDKIIISVKMSDLQPMIQAYEKISTQCKFPLHLGLTEAGSNTKWVVSSSAALSILLEQWIGDTIRVSLTPEPWTPRSLEVEVCKNILQSMGFRSFEPQVVSCPWCGRTSSDKFQHLAKYVGEQIKARMPQWTREYEWFEDCHIAVMGCIVNGIWEAKNADIGIFIPWDYEKPQLQIYVKWKHLMNLEGTNIIEVGRIFLEEIEKYFAASYIKKNL